MGKFVFLLLIFHIIATLAKYSVLVQNVPPYIYCEEFNSNMVFSGLDIEYSKKLIKKLNENNISFDWEFKCVSFSNISNLLLDKDILFFIGGISSNKLTNFEANGLQISFPIVSSGLSILLFKDLDSYSIFQLIKWDTFLLLIFIPFIISLLQMFFEKSKIPFENFLWNSYAAFFFMNHVRLEKCSSRVLLFSLWILAMVIWVFLFSGIYSEIISNNPNSKILSAFDLNNQLILTEKAYVNDVRIYGAKIITLNYSNFENSILDFITQNNKIMFNGFVFEDPVSNYIQSHDNRFRKIDPKFIPINFHIFFSNDIDKNLMNNINKIIIQLNEEGVSYEQINPELSQNIQIINKIPMQFIQELLIILGISLMISLFFHFFTRCLISKYNFHTLLIDKKIINQFPWTKKDINFAKKYPIRSSFENLKEIIDSEFNKIINEIKLRLEIMSDKINKFYDFLLLNGKIKRKSKDALSEIEKPTKKNKKMWSFPNLPKVRASLDLFKEAKKKI